MTQIKKISKHSYAAHLEDGRVFVLSNRIGDSIGETLGPLNWDPKKSWETGPQYVGEAKIVP